MPKNAKATTSKSEKTEKPVVSAVEAAVEEVQKSVKRTKKSEKAPVEAPSVVATAPSVAPTAPSTAATASSSSDPVEKGKRRQVTTESFAQDFENTIKSVETEIDTIRANDDKNKSKSVRFLRTVLKQLKQLRADSTRLVSKKPRRASTNTGNNNSGFMKPVKISSEMQKFVGLKDDQLISRVDVTKAICNYVSSHNLQNEGDRRRFTPDETLSKLLNTKAPLAYYELQKHIQPHFIK